MHVCVCACVCTKHRYFDENLRDDNVPYSDFDAPIDEDNPRDSSSTAIVASALLELFQLTGTHACSCNTQTIYDDDEASLQCLVSPLAKKATHGWARFRAGDDVYVFYFAYLIIDYLDHAWIIVCVALPPQNPMLTYYLFFFLSLRVILCVCVCVCARHGRATQAGYFTNTILFQQCCNV